jgi:predicted metal-dependent phosphoesterase TrpH
MIDLHTHSNVSDGTDSPSQLINKAHSQGLTVVALTDHDSTAGWNEAITALRPGMDLVLGSEISCQAEGGFSVHMLGLLFDGDNQELQTSMAKVRENRIGRMEKIIARLNEAGIDINMADVEAQLSEGATLGRPHLADALIKKGVAANRDEIFANLLHNNSKFYIPHYSPTPEAVIKMIKAAGGVAVIAHPYASLRGRTIDEAAFAPMVEAGLDGIEVFHRDHTPEQHDLLVRIAKEFDLVTTGSSDYHGEGKLNTLAEFTTSPAEWEKLEARANQRRVVRK